MTRKTNDLQPSALADFLGRHRLPDAFAATAKDHYLPLARRLPGWRKTGEPLALGINGGQGTGKSTLADFLQLACQSLFGWRSAVLSIDDFYLTRAERQSLAADVHPLLATRGVPGTHDTRLLSTTLDTLTALADGKSTRLPRFDKANDDRLRPDYWPIVDGPLDLVVLEGWCVGSVAQQDTALAEPINALERDEDPDGRWRRYANDRLRRDYAPVFDRLDALVFFAVPDFDAVFRWRREQEQKLAATSAGAAIMDDAELARFVRFYERLTRHNLATLPSRADALLLLDNNHAVVRSSYRAR